MNTVTFPNLGLEFTLNKTAFTLFGISVAWYAIIIAVGFLLAVGYALYRLKDFGLDEDRVMDVIIFGMLGGIVGARLYFVAFQWELYADDWTQIFNTRAGGLAIYGGLIGALLIGGIVCKIRKVKILPMFDIAVMGFLIGQGIGRWGNFVNVEAYGSETDSLFAMMSSSIGNNAVHPCFLYESFWCLLGFVLLHFYSKRRRFDGEILLLYCVWYGFGRAIIEGLRTDSLYWGPFRVSQMLSVAICVAALITWVVIRSKIKRENDPAYLKLYVHTEESAMILKEAEARRLKKKNKDTISNNNETTEDEALHEHLEENLEDEETLRELETLDGVEVGQIEDNDEIEQKTEE